MGTVFRLTSAALGLLAGLQAATQLAAWSYGFAPALGLGLTIGSETKIYAPWSIAVWLSRFSGMTPNAFTSATSLILLGVASGLAVPMVFIGDARPRRSRGWGDLGEARTAGLLSKGGCILGLMNGRLLATTDLRPTLVTGGTRSGKGRGHVVPTLLSWTESVLVHDPKGELWTVTAGWRSSFSHALRFDPRDLTSARWNPLAEIQPGPGELAQVQRLTAILADPGGARDDEAIWDKSATEIVEAVILHVLYAAADHEKTLLKVREMLADLDTAAETMLRTLHRPGSDGAPQTHPFIKTAITGYSAMHDRFRTSVQGTARSYLKWLAGEDIERALSVSDVTLGDLMCANAPVSLYVQVAPADAVALRPLVRLLFYAAAQSLTAHEDAAADGRPKHHALLMVMDEFPMLGRLQFFEKSLRLMSGYRIKTLFVAQSLNDIVETFLTWKRVEARVGISRTTAWRLQRADAFPKPRNLSPGRVGYIEAEVEAWKASRAHRSASRSRPPPSKAKHGPSPPVREPTVRRPIPPAPEPPPLSPPPPTPASLAAPPRPRSPSRGRKSPPNQLSFDL